MTEQKDILAAAVEKEYSEGFVTDIEQEFVPKGLNEDIIRLISAKKDEPEWMLEFRLDAFRKWKTMTPPKWGHLSRLPMEFAVEAQKLLSVNLEGSIG